MDAIAYEGREGRTTAAAVLNQVASLLKTSLRMEDHACFVTLDPHGEASRLPGDLWITISPMSGTFVDRYLVGGAQAQVTLHWGLVVAIHSTSRLDEVGRSPLWMSGEADKTMELVDRILGALTCQGTAWGLRDPLMPDRIDFAEPRSSQRTVELSFSCSFDWLCQAPEGVA